MTRSDELTIESWARCVTLLEADETATVLEERAKGPSKLRTGRLARTRCTLVQLGRTDAWARHCRNIDLADALDAIDAKYGPVGEAGDV